MVDLAQTATNALQTAGSSILNSLLPQQAPAQPQVQYVQAPKTTNWALWGGIALAGIVGLVILKKVMGGRSAAAPTATNPRRRRRRSRR